MKLTYLFLGVLEIAVRLPRRVQILFVPVTHLCGLVLDSISLCFLRIHHFQHFPYVMSIVSYLNRRARFKDLTWERICRCKMQLLWMKHRCKPRFFYLLWYIQLVHLVGYVPEDFLWPSVFHAQRLTTSLASEMPCIHIDYISDFVSEMWLPVLIGPVGLLFLCPCELIL